jgi:uncharacterized membrane protein YGL010W
MKTLTDHLTQYAAYHQDRRNVVTHFVGIPMIVLAVATLLSRPGVDVGGMVLTPVMLVSALSLWFYLRLDLRFGVAMGVQLAISIGVGQWFAAQSTAVWLSAGVGLFVVGWIIQFVGHYFEGKKPAFVDDLVGLLVGPLFLTAEVAFALRWRLDVHAEIQRRLRSANVTAAGATA